MTLDFSRSSAPCAGPLNIAYSTAVACCYVVSQARLHRRPGQCRLPASHHVRYSRARRFSASSRRSPWAAGTETILRVIGVVFGACEGGSEPRHGRAVRHDQRLVSPAIAQDGSRWVMFSFFGGGLGGNPESDGLNHANNPISTATIPPLRSSRQPIR